MAKRRSTADADDGGAKTPRKPNFSDADVRLLLNKYLEKKSIFQNEENSVINNRAQEGEWERIAQAMNSQNPLLCRSWKEIRKKYYNLASEAKKLHTKQKASMLATGGGVVDPDVAARSYEELPFWARFILEEILPAVIVDGVEGGFESETNAAAALEADDTQEFDSPPESTQTTITTTAADDINIEEVFSPPPSSLPTPDSSRPSSQSQGRRTIDKRLLDEATYEALMEEKKKYAAEAEYLKEKTECQKIKRELLAIALFEKKRQYEEVSLEARQNK